MIYRIDQTGVITSVNDAWQRFAAENQGQAVMGDRVLGRELREFITDSTLRSLYKLLVDRARRGEPVCFKYRCDAPDRRRWWVMTITGLDGGEMEFESSLLREEARSAVAILESDRPRSEQFVIICSWCQKLRVPVDTWLPVEKAVRRLDLMEADPLPRISHSICPACQQAMYQQLDDTKSETGG